MSRDLNSRFDLRDSRRRILRDTHIVTLPAKHLTPTQRISIVFDTLEHHATVTALTVVTIYLQHG